MLYNLVKAEEITEKFDSLNKQTATKIEKFIRDQIRMLLDAQEIEQKIKLVVKEFEIEFKKRSNEMKVEQQKRRVLMAQELLMDCFSDV